MTFQPHQCMAATVHLRLEWMISSTAHAPGYSRTAALLQIMTFPLRIHCILGDIRLWVGDPSTPSCIVSLRLGLSIHVNL